MWRLALNEVVRMRFGSLSFSYGDGSIYELSKRGSSCGLFYGRTVLAAKRKTESRDFFYWVIDRMF
jgi:hypothetical protein